MAAGYANPENTIEEIRVPSKSVPTLLRDEKIAKIDVLEIDAEGYDWRIYRNSTLMVWA